MLFEAFNDLKAMSWELIYLAILREGVVLFFSLSR